MSVTHTATSQATPDTGTSLTWPHVVESDDVYLLVDCSQDLSADVTTQPTCTYNGVNVPAKSGTAVQHTDIGQWSRPKITFELVNPDVGTHDVIISGLNAGAVTKHGIASTYKGVDTGTPSGTPVTSFGVGGTNGITTTNGAVTSATGDLVYDSVAIDGGGTGGTLTAQTGTIPTNGKSDSNMVLAISHEAGAASVTPNWDWTGSQTFEQVAFNIKAATGGGGGLSVFLEEPIIGGSTF